MLEPDGAEVVVDLTSLTFETDGDLARWLDGEGWIDDGTSATRSDGVGAKRVRITTQPTGDEAALAQLLGAVVDAWRLNQSWAADAD